MMTMMMTMTTMMMMSYWSLFIMLSMSRVVESQEDNHGSGSFGSMLLPRDVAFDGAARQALKDILENYPVIVTDYTTDSTTTSRSMNIINSALEELSDCGDGDKVTLTLIGYKGGTLEDQINQDRSMIITPFLQREDFLISAVFDGHGHRGEEVSQFALHQTPKRLAQTLHHHIQQQQQHQQKAAPADPADSDTSIQHVDDHTIVQAIKHTFLQIDQDVPTGGIGGCTASLVLRLGPRVFIANAGDSISLLAVYDAKSDRVSLLHVTREDKPHLVDERRRIEAMGGRVHIPPSLQHESSRVLHVDPNTGAQTGLAMSRSIGDWDMVGVIAEPIVRVIHLGQVVEELIQSVHEKCSNEATETCEIISEEDIHFFCVSATDGMMDYIEPKELAERWATAFFRNDSDDGDDIHPINTAEDLIHEAARGWHEETEGQYRDDIAIAAARIIL